MKDVALVSLFFNYPKDRLPLIYNNAIKFFDKEDIYVARFEELDPTVSYYEKLYKFKIICLYDFLKDNIKDKYKYMLFVDATDTNFFRNPSDIIEIFESFNKKIVFCGEKELWPVTQYTNLYDEKQRNGPFKFLNSGGYFGYTESILDHMKNILEKDYYGKIEDQSTWTIEYLLHEDIEIDSEGKIFFSTHMNKNYVKLENDKIILNDINPIIIHDNGPYGDNTFKFTHLL